MTWRATVLTLFPAMFPGTLGQSLAGRALVEGIWSLDVRDIREHGIGRHRAVDDTPFGGGAGMVMRPDVADAAIAAAPAGLPLVYLTPRGRLLDQAFARALAATRGWTSASSKLGARARSRSATWCFRAASSRPSCCSTPRSACCPA